MEVLAPASAPGVLDLEAVGKPVVEAGEAPAELLGQPQERPHRLGHLGGGDVHGEGHEVAGQCQDHLLGDGDAGLVLGLGRRRPEVGGGHHARQREQRRVGARLGGEHVEGGPGHLAGLQRLVERLLVEDAAARGVDDAQARLGLGQEVAPDEPRGLGGLREMDGDEVARGHQLVERRAAPPPSAGPGPATRRGRRRTAASRRPARAGPPARRCDRARPRRASCRGARRPPTWSAPTSRPPGRRGPEGCCGPGPATGPRRARPPRGCSTAGRSRP